MITPKGTIRNDLLMFERKILKSIILDVARRRANTGEWRIRNNAEIKRMYRKPNIDDISNRGRGDHAWRKVGRLKKIFGTMWH